MAYTSEYFGPSAGNYANDDLVQLIDNFTKEDVNFIKITKWIDGTVINSSNESNFIDGTIYMKKDTNVYYVREIIFGGERMNIKWFGAEGNGTSDDTLSIQTAFNLLFKLRNAESITSIFFPNGNYLVTDMLKFPCGCELIGDNKRSTRIFTNDNHYDLIYVYENADFSTNNNDTVYWTTIKNINLAGKNRNLSISDEFFYSPDCHIKTNNANSGIVFNKLSRTYLENIIIEGFETSGLLYNECYYHRFNHIMIRKNKIGLLTYKCTSIHGLNSEFRFNSVGHSLQENTYSCSFVNCMLESNYGKYMSDDIDYNSTPDYHNGVAVYMNNSFKNVYSNCYFERHICTFYLINSYNNIINNSFICAGSTYNYTNLDGNSGFLNNSKDNIFEKNLYYTGNENKAKYYLSSTSINNYFEFTDLESFNDFIIKLDNINNFTDKTHAPKAILSSHNKMFINGIVLPINIGISTGTTIQRPSANSINVGFQFFDTTLNKPIWWDGSYWRDFSGLII